MAFKVGLIALTLLVGSLAKPAKEDDMSIFFDHTDPDARIVGGTVAGTNPWMVALTNGLLVRNLWCGASIITERHLLTAAHCIDAAFSGGSLSSSLRATVGTNRWNHGGVHYAIARNITHPNFVPTTVKNDIAILITRDAIHFTDTISPVTLSFDVVGNGVATTVYGWGRIRAGGAISAQLLELQAATIDGLVCMIEVPRVAIEIDYPSHPPPVEPHIEICTHHSVGHGTCNGDSGSPLLKSDTRQQIGIVSWGIPCAHGAPDMFVRISAYKAWLEATIL
ncbi:chymotrypsin-1-like [Pieris brassicae]|uniref:chymotrypsin-1-like n=1 Tax=Pieris brassicae TaxID=7116 RepID=UPI001E65E4BB|nr:chymotrypsin-1-like [Pieris brassicae]